MAKSSPYFELYRAWQRVNDLSWKDEQGDKHEPTLEQKQLLVNEYKKQDLRQF